MTDTTDQQAVTVAQEDHTAAINFLDQHAGQDWSLDWLVANAIAHARLASVSSASAEPRKDTVAFVQDWLMNSDYDPTQFDKGFAAAIDARHGFDDAALTAIAERFCAAPLPDTVCADLVAIKPMAGRSGTNLMTVAEAKAVLRSIFPEPVPATNQAGEVEREAIARIIIGPRNDLPASEAKLRPTLRQLQDIRWEWSSEQERKEALWIADRVIAALATQPATSQEGEDHGLGPHAAVVEDGEDGFMPVAIVVGSNVYLSQGGRQLTMSPEQFAEIASHSLAATPTPPTLSEDLREESIAAFGAVMFGHIWESFTDDRWDIEINDLVTVDAVKAGLVSVAPYDAEIHNDQSGAAEVGDDFYEITPAGRAALAQVKAS